MREYEFQRYTHGIRLYDRTHDLYVMDHRLIFAMFEKSGVEVPEESSALVSLTPNTNEIYRNLWPKRNRRK